MLEIAGAVIIGGIVLLLILGALSNSAQRADRKWDN